MPIPVLSELGRPVDVLWFVECYTAYHPRGHDTAVATAPTETVTGYDFGVSAAFTDAEVANMAGEVHLAWRPAGGGDAFANDLILIREPGTNTFSATLYRLDAGHYDLKVYYLDAAGREVIQQGIRRRRFRRVDSRLAAEATLAAVQRVMEPEFLADSSLSLSQAIEQVEDLILNGLLHPDNARPRRKG